MRYALGVTSESAEETRILGASLAPLLVPGDVLSLNGDLGAGKTVFVQGLATALGVVQRVSSPSFTLVQEYQARYPIVHLDVYRLNSLQEVIDLGFEELLDPAAILVVEWGEAVRPLLPSRYLEIEIRRSDPEHENRRHLTFSPSGDEWSRKLGAMRATAETLLDAASAEPGMRARFTVAEQARLRDDTQTDVWPDAEA